MCVFFVWVRESPTIKRQIRKQLKKPKNEGDRYRSRNWFEILARNEGDGRRDWGTSFGSRLVGDGRWPEMEDGRRWRTHSGGLVRGGVLYLVYSWEENG